MDSDAVLLNSMNHDASEVEEDVDVLVVGGGLSGLAFSLHMKINLPQAEVAVIERASAPTYKVGESTLSIFTKFCNQNLLPYEYLLRLLYPKDGLRFYSFTEEDKGIPGHVNVGALDVAYQCDRSLFELLLQLQCQRKGVKVYRGYSAEVPSVDEVEANLVKQIPYSTSDGASSEFQTRFIVDATGSPSQLGTEKGELMTPKDWNTNSYWTYYKVPDELPDITVPFFKNAASKHFCFKEGWFWYLQIISWKNSPWPNLVNMCLDLLDMHNRGVPADDVPSTQELAKKHGCTFERLMSVGVVVRTDEDAKIDCPPDAKSRYHYWKDLHPDVKSFLNAHQWHDGEAPLPYMHRHNLEYVCPNVCGRGWMSIGMAASFTNPIFSPGMNVCYFHAKLAAEYIRKMILYQDLSHEHFLGEYKGTLTLLHNYLAKDMRLWYCGFRHKQLFEKLLTIRMAMAIGDEYENFRSMYDYTDTFYFWGFRDERYRDFLDTVIPLIDIPNFDLLKAAVVPYVLSLADQFITDHVLPTFPHNLWGRYFTEFDDQLRKVPGKNELDAGGNFKFMVCECCKVPRPDHMMTCAFCGFKLDYKPRINYGGLGSTKSNVSQNKEYKRMVDAAPDEWRLGILYSSQGGTGARLARRLQGTLADSGISSTCKQMPSPAAKVYTYDMVIFVLSSFGNGGPADDAKVFWDYIHQPARVERNCCTAISYAMVGLGDSNYPLYNGMAKKTHAQLQALGSTSVIEPFYRDAAADNPEANIEAWIDKIKYVCIHETPKNIDKCKAEGKFMSVALDADGREEKKQDGDFQKRVSQRQSVLLPISSENEELKGYIQENSEACAGGSKSIRLVRIAMEHPVRYSPGQLLKVWPKNNPEVTMKVLEHLNVTANEIVDLGEYSRIANVGHSSIALTVFRKVLDLNGPVTENFLFEIDPFIKGEEKHSMEDKVALATTLKSTKVTVANYVLGLKSLDITLMDFFRVCPKMSSRFYSIASSSEEDPSNLEILVKMVEEDDSFVGTASNYIRSLHVGDELSFHLSTLAFGDTPATSSPLVMVCVSSSVGSFASILRQAVARKKQGLSAKSHQWQLYYGCSSPDVDVLMKPHLDAAVENEVLSKLDICYSKDDRFKKERVQDRLRANSIDVIQLLEQNGARLFISGPVTLYTSLKDLFVELFSSELEITPEDAKMKWDEMVLGDRIVSECWASGDLEITPEGAKMKSDEMILGDHIDPESWA